jgi:hypothetical protein
MSLLQQDASEIDDAAKGESFTKGTSPLIWSLFAAACIVTIAIGAYFMANNKPPASTGEVTRAVAHIVHRETSGLDASGAPMPKEVFDQVLLFTHVKVHNQSKEPLFLRQVMSNLTLDDGIHSVYMATPTDYERLFKVSPELMPFHGTPLALDTTIDPGATLEGEFVAAFRISKAQWDSRKALDYSVSFRYQPDLKLTPASVAMQ